MSKQEITIKYEIVSKSDLPQSLQEADAQINKNIDSAYAPYSNLKVAAVLVLEDGSLIFGTNQENSVLPLGLCAERAALLSYPNISSSPIESLLLTCSPWSDQTQPLSPSGSCRQTIREFELRQNKPIKIYLLSSENDAHVFQSGADLLPYGIKDTFLGDFQ